MITTLFHAAIHTLRYRIFGKRTPLVLSLSVTGRCNLRCVYCYSEEDNKHAADLPATEIFRLIDEFHSLGTRIFMLQGGEPLLHPEIDAIIGYVKSKGAYCSITTNGVFIRQHLNSLKKVNQVQLSIDGNEEITDSNRGKGVYQSLMNAIILCRDNRIPFHLHTVLTRKSTEANTLDPLEKLAKNCGTYLNFCIPAKTGSAADMTLASNEQVNELYKIILRRKKEGSLTTNNTEQGLKEIIDWTEQHNYDAYIPADDPVHTRCYKKCVMGNLVCWLDSTGMLYPCAIKFGQHQFARSIKKEGVSSGWKSLESLPCHYCAGSTEFNNLFRLKPESVINSLKFIFRKRK